MKLLVSSSPHDHSGASIRRIMLDVIIALMPALGVAVWFFKLDALRLTGVCVGTALAAEYACRKFMRRENSLGDLSAVVTGLLLAFNLPPELPAWMAAAGTLFAIVITKQLFGGLGYNPFNPALAGRVFLLISFPGPMTSWTKAVWQKSVDATTRATPLDLDALTTATPLGLAKDALRLGQPLPFEFDPMRFFIGDINGSLGEISALALLVGAAYLLVRRVITWQIPTAFVGSAALYAVALKILFPETAAPVLFHLLSGGLVLGAFFMATDMVTSPVTRYGQLIFGAGCGIVTMVIRTVPSGYYPEGVSFAILFMNAFTPLINRATKPRPFGKTGKKR